MMHQNVTRASVAALVIGVCFGTAICNNLGAAVPLTGQPIDTESYASGLPVLPGDWAVIQGKSAAPAGGAPQAPAQAATPAVNGGGQSYRAMRWEFQNAALCNAYKLDGVDFLSAYPKTPAVRNATIAN